MSEPVDEGSASAPPKGDLVPVLRRMSAYLWRAGPGAFLGGAVLRVVGVLALIAIPALIGAAIGAVQTDRSSSELARFSIIALVVAAVGLVAGVIADRISSRLAARALSDLQEDMFDHMQDLSLGFFDRQPIGELMSRVTNDTESVARYYETVIGPLVRSFFLILTSVVVMFALNWQMALAAVAVIPVMIGLVGFIERVSTPAFDRMQERLGELSGFQEETIAGHKVIQSNRREGWAGTRNEELSDGVFSTGSRAFFAALLQVPITTFVIELQFVVVVVVGALLVVEGSIGIGDVVAFLGFVGLLGIPLSEIANLAGTTLSAAAGARRVFELLDEQPTVVDAPDATEYRFEGGRVEFDHVNFSYVPGRRILKDNTFVAEPGEMIGIVGPTGAGKSTIINILTRYYDLDSGRVLVDGQDLATLTQESLRRQVGVVLQEAYLFTDTVMGNLRYAREGATDEECIAAAKEANAHEFIERLPNGYDTMLIERGSNLSQGQRQMITIARAMVARPKLLILDEATSNVDTRTERLVQEGLQRLMAGRTSFVIAHRLATVRDAARIMVVVDGRIVELAPHDELMAMGGVYHDMYMGQFRGKAPAG